MEIRKPEVVYVLCCYKFSIGLFDVSELLCHCRDGEEWLDFRRIMNRLLLRNDVADTMLEPCTHVADELLESWRTHANSELPNLEAELYRWSLNGM